MTQRPRINVTQTQRLQLNAGLQASIRLLRADAAGLTRYLEEQAAENPHLRLEPPPAPAVGDWLPRWSRVLPGGAGDIEAAEGPGPSLMGHVSAEIDRRMKSPHDRRIALALAEALEPSGWLGRPLTAVAAELGLRLREVEAVLDRLQKIEPAGLFARNLAECLRLQAAEVGQLDAVLATMLEHLDLLAQGEVARLARLCGVPEAEIARRFRLIRSMNPKPGTQFAPLCAPQIREPDLMVRATAGRGWEVALNRSSLPTLRIVEAGEGSAAALTAAKAVQRMVQARNSTLLRVGRAILQRQQAALDRGPRALVPLTMADVALALGLHASTVSRVVAGASVDTPRGTWWLRHLFSAAVGEEGGEQVAAAALRERLMRLVTQEDARAPLTDEELAQLLGRDGPAVARRTVAKYRAMLGIAPTHRRRRR